MKRICIFCGSNFGARPSYVSAAQRMGVALAQRKIGLVYGGAHVGLMGALADATLDAGGEVIGVLPESLAEKELAHMRLTELHIVGSMHARKAMMADLADGFIALPGGFGTFEEFCEAVTWSQLGIHRKPCGLLNVEGFYTPLLQLFDHAVNERFIRLAHRSLIVVNESPDQLLDAFNQFQMPAIPKWLNRAES